MGSEISCCDIIKKTTGNEIQILEPAYKYQDWKVFSIDKLRNFFSF